MPSPVLDEIRAFQKANKTGLAATPRRLLEAFIHLAGPAGAERVQAEALRAEMGLRQGNAPNAAGLRQQLKRLNTALSKASATFALKSRGGDIAAEPTSALDEKRHQERVQDALTGMSNELARIDAGGMVEPRAAPEREALSIFYSYAWINAEEQQIQNGFFERLRERLAYPTADFEGLPKIVMWRDVRDMKASDKGDPQMDAGCARSFLGLLMMSHKYPHSDACKREADFFLTADGENQPGKSCIVVGVSLRLNQIPPRFTAGARIVQLGPHGEHLVSLWFRGNTADRSEFVEQVANQIFIAARDFLAARNKRKDAAQFFRLRKLQADPHDMVESRARVGRVSPELASSSSAGGFKDGVPIVAHLIDWVSKADRNAPRLVALLGEFGMGKTVACQLFTQKLLELRTSDPSLPLPIYFDLRDVDRVPDDGRADLEALIDQMLAKAGEEAPSAKEIIQFVRENAVTVIFDGLDEITNKLSHEAAIKLYRELLGIVPSQYWVADNERRRKARRGKAKQEPMAGPRLLVSCRTHYFRDVAAQRAFLTGMERSRLEADADVAAYFMLPFNERQIEEYLRLHLGDEQARRALALIDTTYNLHELAERPILLRFIRETFEQIEREKLAGRTINLTRLYDIFVDQVFERDNPKHIIPPREKRLLLQALALHLQRRRQSEIGNDKLDEWFQGCIATMPRLAAALRGMDALKLSEIFAQDLRNASLLVRPGEKSFRFAHTSIREYFLASALYAAARDGGAEAAWDLSPPTSETLTFLLQRHAVEEPPERREFEAQFMKLLEPGQPLAVRELAFALWLAAERSGEPLPRPDRIDLSEFELRRKEFAGAASRLLPLQRSVWRGAQLHQAEFRSVDLTDAQCDHMEAPMSRWLACRLDGADFGTSNLTGLEWRDCDIPDDALQRAQIVGARAAGCVRAGKAWRPQPTIAAAARGWQLFPNAFRVHAIALGRLGGKDVVVSGGYDKAIRVFDLNTGKPLAVLEGHQGPVMSVAVARLGGKDVVVSGGDDKAIRVFDLNTGKPLAVLEGHQDWVMSVAVARLGGKDVVVSGGDDKAIRVFDLNTGKPLAVLEGHQGPVMSVAVARLGGKDVVVSGGDDKAIRVFDLNTGKPLAVLEGHQGPVMSVAVARLGGKDVVVSGGDDKAIRVFDLNTGKPLAVLEGHQGPVMSVAVARLGGKDVVVSGGYDKAIRVFDLNTGKPLAVLEGHQDWVMSVAVARLGGKDVVVSGGSDKAIRVFDLNTGKPLAVLEGHQGPVMSVAVARLGGKDVVVSGGDDKAIRVFDLNTGKPLAVLEGHQGPVMSVAVARLGGKDVVVSGGDDKAIRVFDLNTGKPLAVLEGHQGPVMSVAVARLGGKDVVVSGGDDKAIRVFDLNTGKPLAVLEGHQGPVMSVAVARLGGKDVVVSGGYDKAIRVFDLNTGKPLAVLEGHQDWVMSVAVARLGGKDVVVSGGDDKAIRVFDLNTGKPLAVLEGHQGPVMSVAVARLGGKDVVVSGGDDKAIRVFDLNTGKPLAVLEGHQGPVMSVAVARLGGKDVVVSGGYDGVVRAISYDARSFSAAWKLYVVPKAGSAVALKPEGDRGDLLVWATPDAWRDWFATYRAEGSLWTTEIDDVPRFDNG